MVRGSGRAAAGGGAAGSSVLAALPEEYEQQFVRRLCLRAGRAGVRLRTGSRQVAIPGLSADRDFLGRGLKAQMKEADRCEVRIIINDEIAVGKYASG